MKYDVCIMTRAAEYNNKNILLYVNVNSVPVLSAMLHLPTCLDSSGAGERVVDNCRH